MQRQPPSGRHRNRAAISFVAWVTWFAVATGPANAAFPGSDGRIAYGVWGAPQMVKHEIFTVRPNGTGNRALALDASAEPAWSPDGRLLAFTRPDGIWTARADGSSAAQVVTLPHPWHSLEHPKWAPDGRRISFEASRSYPVPGPEDSRSRRFVLVVTPDGQVDRLRQGTSPVWSPDGKRIAYVSRRGDALKSMSPDGGRPRTLARVAGFPSDLDFSPDGRKLLFIEHRAFPAGKLRVLDFHDRKIRTLRVHGQPLAAVWAPSGERIAYLWQRNSRPGEGVAATQIWTMRHNGSRQKRRFTLSQHRWAESLSWQPR